MMKGQPRAVVRALLTALLILPLLTALGCGGDRKKLIGSWALEIPPIRGAVTSSVSVTITLREDGTGTMDAAHSLMPQLPASQSQSFEWELRGDTLILSMPEAGVTQELLYELDRRDELILRAGPRGAEQRYRRVK